MEMSVFQLAKQVFEENRGVSEDIALLMAVDAAAKQMQSTQTKQESNTTKRGRGRPRKYDLTGMSVGENQLFHLGTGMRSSVNARYAGAVGSLQRQAHEFGWNITTSLRHNMLSVTRNS